MNKKYKCPCCGNLTLREEPSGSYEICSVCCWEDDNVQFLDPDFEGGANEISLNEAKRNYIRYGAIAEKYISRIKD